MNDVELLNTLGLDKNIRQVLISKCKTAICYMASVSLTSRGMYEGMGLSGFKAKAYSIFSLYQALSINPTGLVVRYLKKDFSDRYYLYSQESRIKNLSEEDFKNLERNDKGIKQHDGIKHLTDCLFPPEILKQSLGTSTSNDLVYDPGSDEDFSQTICYRVLRDISSGDLGNDVYSMMDMGEDSSVSLLLLTLLNDKKEGGEWLKTVHELIPNETLRGMVLRTLPLLQLVYLYKQVNLT